MFCPNCGKPVKDYDNFCRYCGVDLRAKNAEEPADTVMVETDEKVEAQEAIQEQPLTTKNISDDEQEEYVLYDVKKHWMAVFWTMFLTPVFLLYFWNIFLHTHSILSWIVVLAILTGMIYPAARYKSDSIVITNKFAHIKVGVIKPEEINIPVEDFGMFDVGQTVVGKMFGYGTIIFHANAQLYEYKYITQIDHVKYIFSEPQKFIKENL